MIDLWVSQAVHLSIGQSALLFALSVALIGLMFYYNGLEK